MHVKQSAKTYKIVHYNVHAMIYITGNFVPDIRTLLKQYFHHSYTCSQTRTLIQHKNR